MRIKYSYHVSSQSKHINHRVFVEVFLHCDDERSVLLSCCPFFVSFFFSMPSKVQNSNSKFSKNSKIPSKVIITVIQFGLLVINIFWALLRPHFSPRLTAGAKITLSRAQNKFIPGDVNSTVSLRAFGTLLSDAQLFFIMICNNSRS